MAQQGPIGINTTRYQVGLMQVRVTPTSAANTAQSGEILTSSNSIGSLANTAITFEDKILEHESGFPQLTDAVIRVGRNASIKCTFDELTRQNIALALGQNPSSYTNLSGTVPIGDLSGVNYVMVEGVITYPDGTMTSAVIFPRALATIDGDLSFSKDGFASASITFKANISSSDNASGNVVWNNNPLGIMRFN